MEQKEPAKRAAKAKKTAPKDGLAHLHRATDTLGSLLAQAVQDLESSQSAAHAAGTDPVAAMKGLKEATAVLKDLAAVAKTLNEQGAEGVGAACGVVLLPPVQQEGESEP